MKHVIVTFFIFISFFSFSQKTNSELESEISLLNDTIKVKNYWIQIHKLDQSVRGRVTEKQTKIDRQNIKKMLLLFKYYGYPTGFCYGCNPKSPDQKNFTPNIIITHNSVAEVSEIIFPILKKAYEEGKANEFWYIHNLRGMVRDRYGKDYYEKSKENIPKFYEKLNPFIKNEITYDLKVIDSIFNEYDQNIKNILSSQLIFSKKENRVKSNIFLTEKGKLYWQKVYNDGSFNFPQEVYFDDKNNYLKYALSNEIIEEKIILKNIDKIKDGIEKNYR